MSSRGRVVLQRLGALGHRVGEEPFAPVLLVLLGALLACAVTFIDYPFGDWDYEAKDFVGRAETLLWFLFLFGQVGLWLALQPPAWRAFKAVEAGGESKATVIGLGIIGVSVASAVYLGSTVQVAYPLPGHGWKLAVVTTLGGVASAPAVLCVWRLHRVIARETADASWGTLAGYADEKNAHPLAGVLSLRELLDRALVLLGLIVGAAILATGAFRNAVLAWHPPAGEGQPEVFPVEYVLLYGAFFTLLLALVYVPTYLKLQGAGRAIIAAYVPVDQETEEVAEAYEKRQQLTILLRLDTSVASSFFAGAAIVTPLASSLLGAILSTG